MGRLLDGIEEKRAVLLAAKEAAERTRKDARKVRSVLTVVVGLGAVPVVAVCCCLLLVACCFGGRSSFGSGGRCDPFDLDRRKLPLLSG